MNFDPRVDAYIEKSQPFAQPILEYLRKLIHDTIPEVTETVKWGMPSYDYKGPLCSMAAFKQHCAFAFWKAALMKDAEELRDNQESSMGHAGKIQSLKDLPSKKKLQGWIMEAAILNEQGIKLPPKKKTEKGDIVIPDYFEKVLSKNKKAANTFKNFSPSHQREYIEWITDAKTEPTREKRIKTTIENLNEEKSLNWKYQRK